MKEVPLVFYEDGVRRVVGIARVSTGRDGLTVEGIVKDPDFGRRVRGDNVGQVTILPVERREDEEEGVYTEPPVGRITISEDDAGLVFSASDPIVPVEGGEQILSPEVLLD